MANFLPSRPFRLRTAAAALVAVAFVATVGRAGVVGAQQPELPAPRGYVNDFANVLTADAEARLESITRIVQQRSGGEIAIVTLRDLEGRSVEETALRIGREWGVGASAAVGDTRRNAGTVILLVPKETSSDSRGYCRIETGMGAEGFLTDAQSGSICRSARDRFQVADYGAGLLVVASGVATRYAEEFGFSLADGEVQLPQAPRGRSTRSGGSAFTSLLFMLFLLFVMGRGRGSGCLPFLVANSLANSHRGWGGGGFGGGFGGGGFGGGGGGFGGFGGGGGFSGGGGGDSW